MKKSLILFALAGATTLFGINASADIREIVKGVQKMDHRTQADTARDKNRKPAEALAFFGLEKDMKVIEFLPGAGWYSKILAPVLKDEGKLYIANRQEWFDQLEPIFDKKPMQKAVKLPIDIDSKQDRYEFGNLDFGMTDADMILNIREYHGFGEKGKKTLNAAAFKALKPGGKYIIVDHTRRHMQPETPEVGRREDPVSVILEVQSAGFILDKVSDMFYRADDELRYEVGRRTVTGNTDRFSLVFSKPR